MTVMCHKSVDARRQRRTRLKRAMAPILARFGCTQMQALDHVNGMLSANARLAIELEEARRERDNLSRELAVAKGDLVLARETLDLTTSELAEATKELAKVKKDVVKAGADADAGAGAG
jgi:hypothetical protein